MISKKFSGHIAVFAANIFFGLNNPLSRSLMPEIIDPYVLTFLRISGGMTIFWVVSVFLKYEEVAVKDIILYFFAAIFAISANQLPFFAGLSMTSPIDASIVITLLPILSMILAAIFIKEPLTLMKATGVIVGASGALILIINSHSTGLGSGNLFGNLIVFSAVTSFALYLVLFKSLISRYSPITSMKWMFLFGTIQSFPFCRHALMATDFSLLNTSAWIIIVYAVVVATFIAYILIAIGQKTLRPTTLSMYNYLQPVVASLVAVYMGIDSFGIEKMLSAVLVFLGVYIVTQSKSRAQLEAEKAGIPVNKDEVGN
ncbi:MAG: EamA family transporter [Paludibacter sp.]|nr:EamA family transporter [Paludibacter sp.]